MNESQPCVKSEKSNFCNIPLLTERHRIKVTVSKTLDVAAVCMIFSVM